MINQLMADGRMNDEYLINPKEAPKEEKKEYRTSEGNFFFKYGRHGRFQFLSCCMNQLVIPPF